MKQKIVIKVQVRCDKCRSKAMKIAVGTAGVMSVTWEGDEKDEVVVTGDGVDAATLSKRLKKKLGFARLVSVEEVKENVPVNHTEPTPSPCPSSSSCEYQLYKVVYEDSYPTTCNIM